MNEEIQNRLAALRDEYEKGRERLRELQRQQSQVEETLLRIEGAMTVLQEFLARARTRHPPWPQGR